MTYPKIDGGSPRESGPLERCRKIEPQPLDNAAADVQRAIVVRSVRDELHASMPIAWRFTGGRSTTSDDSESALATRAAKNAMEDTCVPLGC